MKVKKRWQVPGNANPFDSELFKWNSSKISQRSIGVLKFILRNNNSVTKTYFEENINIFLKEEFNHIPNNSIASHFYRPLEFVGLIRNIDNNLSISIDGKNFLRYLEEYNYNEALNCYILQLLKAKYPNSATKKANVSLFPFRILFKILLERNYLEKVYLEEKIPYITSFQDIKNLDNINNPNYKKWSSWVVSYLIKFDILQEESKKIALSNSKKEFLENLLQNIEYEDMFFEEDNYIVKKQLTKLSNKNRNQNLIKENDCKCFFNHNHITFPSNYLDNYMEGHHIIPISLQDSFTKDLDCKENIISVFPNCHKAIHFANNKYKEELIL